MSAPADPNPYDILRNPTLPPLHESTRYEPMFPSIDRYDAMEKKEREVKSGWKSLKKSYQDEKLRQKDRDSEDPLFHFYPHMTFLEKSGNRNQPKTMSAIPAFRENEKKFPSASTSNAADDLADSAYADPDELFPEDDDDEGHISSHRVKMEMTDEFVLDGEDSTSDNEVFSPMDLKLSTIIKDEEPRYTKQSTIIGGRGDSLRKRRFEDLLPSQSTTPSATVTANNIRRLKLVRPMNGGSPIHTSMPTLTPNSSRPITMSAINSTTKLTPSSSTPSKSPFLLYMERIYNSVEDSRRVEFEEDMIRFAFDWKKNGSQDV
uniref:BESS domain-containing protein n=1 Tax=Steinernema glaseri TaxID=37863 RepID=A0A1I7Z2F1_9BILA